jgi:cell wall-associated NlpC family hydrolase
MRTEALNIDALTANAYLWRGTPFRANSCQRGPDGGACCHLLVHALYAEAGWVIPEWPPGPPGHSRFSRHSIIATGLDGLPQHFVRLDTTANLQPGDLLGYTIGGAVHHLAILLPNDLIVHAIASLGVVITPRLDPTWSSRHAATWRPIMLPQKP